MAGTQSGGSVHLRAFLRGCSALSRPLGADTAAYAFDGFDADQDGEVTSSEFLGAFFLEHLFQTPKAIEAVGAFSNTAAMAAASPAGSGNIAVVTDGQTTTLPAVVAARLQQWQPPLSFEKFRALISEPVPIVFARIDQNGDSMVSEAEFLDWSRRLSPPLSDSEAEYAFLGLDENRDRWLSSSELTAALSAHSFFLSKVAASPGSLTVGELRRRFGLATFTLPGEAASDATNIVRDLDVSRDGLIDLWEFVHAANHLTVPLTSLEAHQAFAGIDEDGDHRLSTSEFEHVFSTGRLLSPGGNTLAAA